MPISKLVQNSLDTGVVGNGPAFSAYYTGTQNFSATTWTKVQLNQKEFDTANCFSTVSYAFTPNVAGYYQVNTHVQTGLTSSANFMTSAVYKNGSPARYGVSNVGTSNGADSAMSNIIYLNGTTDYIEMYVYQSTSAGATISPNSNSTTFSACLVRAA